MDEISKMTCGIDEHMPAENLVFGTNVLHRSIKPVITGPQEREGF